MTRVLFSSDHHFGHANVVEYCARPFRDVEEMNEMLVERWNARVEPCDTVYHLGDFALGPSGTAARWRARLNGRIVLVLGNHDRSRAHMVAAGFDVVAKDLVAELAGISLWMRHRPPRPSEWERHRQTFHYALHGHVHNAYVRQGNLINVGVDVRGFAPATLAELLAP